MDVDKSVLDANNLAKLEALKNEKVMRVAEEYIKLCKPAKVKVLTDSTEDGDYVKKASLDRGEEKPLKISGHTIHFDASKDLARDTKNTRIMVPKGKTISKHINTIDRDEGLAEVRGLLDGIMKGKEMMIKFYCLGPNNSEFSIPAMQMTDSTYVLHSEDMLYRPGYEDFRRLKGSTEFFHFIHSAGELENGVAKNLDKRRIYMDLEDERVFTINNQYAGNSVGLKKLALRLAISKASREDWLCEHMFVMGVHPQNKGGRVTYFTGAYPSACGKTSTAMVSGQSIIGDDIAYLKKDSEGACRAANVEQGIFGIIQDVSAGDDPVIHKAITTPREVIFSNVLVKDGTPYWLGMGQELPEEGTNYVGKWHKGMKDADGKDVLPAHKNARYTIRLKELANVDPELDNPKGVPVDGIIYGGRDPDTSPPVCQSLSWAHGVFAGGILESETTTATLGAEGLLRHDPMANLDFLVIPFGVYLRKHLKFGDDLDKVPIIFTTNYFLREGGKFLNTRLDKKVWLMWMEGRVHNEFEAIETPIGLLPKYEDLKHLFKAYMGKDYTLEEYNRQFCIRISRQLERLGRMEAIYRGEDHIPGVFFQHIHQQRVRLQNAKRKHGKDVLLPGDME